MHICYLINGLNGGGAALPLPDILSLMQKAGHRVSLVALSRQDGRSEACLHAAGIPFRILGPEHRGLRSFRRLLSLLRKERPDAIWTSLSGASFLGQLCGRLLDIPVVSWQHNAFLKRGNRMLLRATRSIPVLWAADSDVVRRFAIAELGVDGSRIHIWPLFIASPLPAAARWPGNIPFRIGSLGRLHRNKGYDVLIQALAKLDEKHPMLASRVEVFIGGSGPELEPLRSLAARLGVRNLHFEGFIADSHQFLSGLHAYVQPSRNEGLCLAAHEAMQAALPVVASPVGQLIESIVDGKTGLHSEVENVDTLHEALARLIEDPAGAAAMGLAARDHVLRLFARERFESSGRAILERLESEMAKRAGGLALP